MKKFIVSVVILVAMISSTSFAFELEQDKIKHLTVSTGLGFVLDTMLYNGVMNFNSKDRIIVATSLAMIPGIAKEMLDEKVDKNDLIADFAGCLIGSMLGEKFNSVFFVSKYDKVTMLMVKTKF